MVIIMYMLDVVNKNRYKKDRVILHSDCNSFYASVECLLNPQIRNKPVAVGGDVEKRHGIILTKNELAKKYNIKTGEAIWQAKQKCPDLVVVPPRFDIYKKFSKAAREIYYDYTDRIEPFGLDEAWLDLTGNIENFDGYETAKIISSRIKNELGITVSIGVSFNKIFAKFGSDYKKPDAITCITRENFKTIVWNAPAKDLLYVGKATNEKLKRIGIYTIGDIARTPLEILKNQLGKHGEMLYGFANGYDASPVTRFDEQSEVKSIGNSTTTPKDIKSYEDAKIVLYVLCDSVCRRLRQQGFLAKTVCIYIRDCKLKTVNRQHTLQEYTNLTDTITATAYELFRANCNLKIPLRSLGVALTDFSHDNIPRQMSIFADETKLLKSEALDQTLDTLKQRFGNYAVRPAVLLCDTVLSGFNPKDDHTVHPVSFLHI